MKKHISILLLTVVILPFAAHHAFAQIVVVQSTGPTPTKEIEATPTPAANITITPAPTSETTVTPAPTSTPLVTNTQPTPTPEKSNVKTNPLAPITTPTPTPQPIPIAVIKPKLPVKTTPIERIAQFLTIPLGLSPAAFSGDFYAYGGLPYKTNVFLLALANLFIFSGILLTIDPLTYRLLVERFKSLFPTNTNPKRYYRFSQHVEHNYE